MFDSLQFCGIDIVLNKFLIFRIFPGFGVLPGWVMTEDYTMANTMH